MASQELVRAPRGARPQVCNRSSIGHPRALLDEDNFRRALCMGSCDAGWWRDIVLGSRWEHVGLPEANIQGLDLGGDGRKLLVHLLSSEAIITAETLSEVSDRGLKRSDPVVHARAARGEAGQVHEGADHRGWRIHRSSLDREWLECRGRRVRR